MFIIIIIPLDTVYEIQPIILSLSLSMSNDLHRKIGGLNIWTLTGSLLGNVNNRHDNRQTSGYERITVLITDEDYPKEHLFLEMEKKNGGIDSTPCVVP